MGILDVTFPRAEFQHVKDYERIINHILGFNVPITILQFNLTDRGIDIKMDVPDEKLQQITKELRKTSIKVKRRTINIDEELCVDCGACIALCNTGALFFDEELKRQFQENKCVGCQLCVDACPRQAITFN